MVASGAPQVRVKIWVSPGTDYHWLLWLLIRYPGHSSADFWPCHSPWVNSGHPLPDPGVPFCMIRAPPATPMPLSLPEALGVCGRLIRQEDAGHPGCCQLRSPLRPLYDVLVSLTAGWPQTLPCVDVVLEDLPAASAIPHPLLSLL